MRSSGDQQAACFRHLVHGIGPGGGYTRTLIPYAEKYFRLQVSGFRFQVSDFGFRSASGETWGVSWGLFVRAPARLARPVDPCDRRGARTWKRSAGGEFCMAILSRSQFYFRRLHSFPKLNPMVTHSQPGSQGTADTGHQEGHEGWVLLQRSLSDCRREVEVDHERQAWKKRPRFSSL